jgi:hypothetical protein
MKSPLRDLASDPYTWLAVVLATVVVACLALMR